VEIHRIIVEFIHIENLLEDPVYKEIVERSTSPNIGARSVKIGKKFLIESVIGLMQQGHMPKSAYDVLARHFRHEGGTSVEGLKTAELELVEALNLNTGSNVDKAEPKGAVHRPVMQLKKMTKRQKAFYAALCINESDGHEKELGGAIIAAHASKNTLLLKELLLEYFKLEGMGGIAKNMGMEDARKAALEADLPKFCQALWKTAEKVWKLSENLKSDPEWRELAAEYGPGLAAQPANFRVMMPVMHEIVMRISHMRTGALSKSEHYVIARGHLITRLSTMRKDEIDAAARRIRESRLLPQMAGRRR
jgi:hypothetical protein